LIQINMELRGHRMLTVLVMKLPVLVSLGPFRRRIGPNPRGFSAADLLARAGASGPRTVRSLRQSMTVSAHDAYATANALEELLRKQASALSIDLAPAEENPWRMLRHTAAEKKERAARREQGSGRRDAGRMW
jgi:hypothetical protein